jgi:hypothetical protein
MRLFGTMCGTAARGFLIWSVLMSVRRRAALLLTDLIVFVPAVAAISTPRRAAGVASDHPTGRSHGSQSYGVAGSQSHAVPVPQGDAATAR